MKHCPRGCVRTLFTLGCRFFRDEAESAEITREIDVVHGVMFETTVSDISVIAKCPQNTSGFSTYISQVSVISANF